MVYFLEKIVILRYYIKEVNIMKKNIGAFFDIDGTIYRDSLLIEHFKMLVKYEFINMSSWTGRVKQKFEHWEKRNGNYDDYLLELVETYVDALKNLNKNDVEFLAKRVIDLKWERVYRYTRQKLMEHKEKGHKIIIISGSPDFLVEKMALKYEVDDFMASKYLVDKNNIFTGEVVPMWDAKSKKKAINYFCDKYSIDFSKSYAYGDTTGDLTMFKNVKFPVAINPAMRLIKKIKKDKELAERIQIIVERKDVIYSLDSHVKVQ